MRKRVAIVGLVALLAAVGAFVVAAPRAAASGTTLDVADGTVFVRHAGVEVVATEGRPLAEGDEVVTGDDGRAVVLFFDGSTLALEPLSSARIDAARVRDRATIIDVYQAAGTTWHAVHKILDPGSRYEVTTPGMVAAVRGTAFQVTVGDTDDDIQTEEGTVEVTAQRQSVQVTPGLHAAIRHGAPPRAPEQAQRPRAILRVDLVGGAGAIVDRARRAVGVLPDGSLRNTIPGARIERDGDIVRIFVPNASRDMRLVAGASLRTVRYAVLDASGKTLESGQASPSSGPLRQVFDQLRTALPETPAPPLRSPGIVPATPRPLLPVPSASVGGTGAPILSPSLRTLAPTLSVRTPSSAPTLPPTNATPPALSSAPLPQPTTMPATLSAVPTVTAVPSPLDLSASPSATLEPSPLPTLPPSPTLPPVTATPTLATPTIPPATPTVPLATPTLP